MRSTTLAVLVVIASACGGRPIPQVQVESDWVRIPSGTFEMALPEQSRCNSGLVQTRTVTLTHAFDILKTEVTWTEFEAVLNNAPTCLFDDPTICAGDHPVSNVSWADAVRYCNALSEKAGLPACYTCSMTSPCATCSNLCRAVPAFSASKIYDCPGYRLATAAEWEYAYRAGTKTDLYNGSLSSCTGKDGNVDAIAWYSENSGIKPHPVASKTANAWGLFDMAGNVAELVHDHDDRSMEDHTPVTNPCGVPKDTPFGPVPRLIIVRGGAFNDGAGKMDAASREPRPDTTAYASNGFRPVRSVMISE